MKKHFFVLICLFFCSSSYSNETARIHHKNPSYSMFVNYQACFRDLKSNGGSGWDCNFQIYNTTIKKGEHYKDIILPDYTEIVKLVNAYEFDEEKIVAQGNFEQDFNCFATHYTSRTLENQNGQLVCY